jgi:hypothetical protein
MKGRSSVILFASSTADDIKPSLGSVIFIWA